MSAITVRNAQRAVRFETAALKEFAERALTKIRTLRGKSGGVLESLPQIAVVLISDRRIAALHRRFMNLPGPTDVITFQEGDIFISAETARRQSRQFHNSLGKEVRLYIVHGLLHLHGFDDRTAAGAREMQRVQERILAALTGR